MADSALISRLRAAAFPEGEALETQKRGRFNRGAIRKHEKTQ